MISANTRVRALALVVCGLLGVIVGGVIVGFATRHGAPIERAELAPDLDVVRYRYSSSPTVDPAPETAKTIATLEARFKTMPSPFDAAELADLYFRRAQLDGNKQDYDTAEAMARRSLELLRSPNPALITLAKLANARHQFREAIDLAHEGKQKSPGVQIVLATAYLALGELDLAALAANTAVSIKPDSGSYQMRALVMQAQGRDAEAAFDFSNAARVEEHGDAQGAARTRALWGRFLLRRGELAGAAELFAEALRIVPGFPLALELQGELALHTKGRAKEAAALFEQAFAASRQVRYLIDEARAQELAGELANANALRTQVESIVRAELGEGGLGHRLDLVEVLVDRGNSVQLAEAVTLATEEVTKRGSFEARFQLARALARSGRNDDAMVQIQAALSNGTREAQVYELASQLETRRGNLARAALYTKLADRIDPGSSGWRGLGLRP